MIWSMARKLKLMVISSTMGLSPPMAAPMPAPTTTDSEMGVSRTRSGPNSSSRPAGDAVGAAVGADVLAHEDDALVAQQRLADGLAQRFSKGDLSHR